MQEVGCTGKELYYMRKPLPTAGDVSGVLRQCPARVDPHRRGEAVQRLGICENQPGRRQTTFPTLCRPD